jgi:hypothetical protein
MKYGMNLHRLAVFSAQNFCRYDQPCADSSLFCDQSIILYFYFELGFLYFDMYCWSNISVGVDMQEVSEFVIGWCRAHNIS